MTGCLYVCLDMSVYLSTCPCTCVSIYTFVHLSMSEKDNEKFNDIPILHTHTNTDTNTHTHKWEAWQEWSPLLIFTFAAPTNPSTDRIELGLRPRAALPGRR